MLDKFSSWVKETSSSLKDEVQKFRNRDFLEATVAGCALVAGADGNISSEEKRKMISFIEMNDALKVFKLDDVISQFESFTGKVNFDKEIGHAECMKSIHKLKKRSAEGRLMVRVCCAIGSSDGDFDETEKGVVREICKELDLDPADFNL